MQSTVAKVITGVFGAITLYLLVFNGKNTTAIIAAGTAGAASDIAALQGRAA